MIPSDLYKVNLDPDAHPSIMSVPAPIQTFHKLGDLMLKLLDPQALALMDYNSKNLNINCIQHLYTL